VPHTAADKGVKFASVANTWRTGSKGATSELARGFFSKIPMRSARREPPAQFVKEMQYCTIGSTVCTGQGREMTCQSTDCSRCVAAFSIYMPISWFRSARGMRLPLYLTSICFAILIRGGGPLSLDRLLVREI
jgi:hypothetical protein